MTYRKMPPEAYTHRELADAMKWREGQPEYIKAMTTTPDTLMSLFKRAQRSNDSNLESKMSEAFKSDLKNIAEGLKNFDSPEQPQTSPQPPTQSPTQAPVQPQPVNNVKFELPVAKFEEATAAPQQFSQKSSSMPLEIPVSAPPQLASLLDTESFETVQKLRKTLNLSSDTEALRALIALGRQKASSILSE